MKPIATGPALVFLNGKYLGETTSVGYAESLKQLESEIISSLMIPPDLISPRHCEAWQWYYEHAMPDLVRDLPDDVFQVLGPNQARLVQGLAAAEADFMVWAENWWTEHCRF